RIATLANRRPELTGPPRASSGFIPPDPVPRLSPWHCSEGDDRDGSVHASHSGRRRGARRRLTGGPPPAPPERESSIAQSAPGALPTRKGSRTDNPANAAPFACD